MATVFFSQALKDELRRIGDLLYDAGNESNNRGHDAETDLFVGPIVSGVWFFVANRLYDLGNLVNWVWNRLWDLEVYLENTGTREWVRDRLTELWGDFSSFINDPIGFVKGRLYAYVPALRNIFDDPVTWFNVTIYTHFRPLYDLWQDPFGTVKQEIYNHIPDLRNIFDDPVTWFNVWTYTHFRTLYLLLQDPRQWVKDRAAEMTGVGAAFWADPFGYILDQVMMLLESRISTYSGVIYRTAERLLRYFWEGVWT